MQLPPIFINSPVEERDYFVSMAMEHDKELSLHKKQGGLWVTDGSGKNWANVTEHCLMEAARVKTFGRLLDFPEDLNKNLVSAALVHDFNKREEIKLTLEDIASGGSGRGGALQSEGIDKKILKEAGFSDLIISLAGRLTADPEDLYFIKDILDLSNPSVEETAHLVTHYVDNYTRGSRWAEPAEKKGEMVVNDVDRRNDGNASNPAYEKMNKEGLMLHGGHSFFEGKTRFEAASAVNHLIEKKFSKIMESRGIEVDPMNVPELVDAEIKKEIYRV